MISDYGIYVWPAYGVTLFILGLNIFFALREKRKTHRFLKKSLVDRHES